MAPANRDAAGRFPPGQSGNPSGRAKKLADLAVKITALDDAHRERLEFIAAQGEPKDSIAAIKLLWAYAYGAPSQSITGPDGGPVQVSTETIIASLDRLKADGG